MQDNKVRIPTQKRSIDKKKRIIECAKILFLDLGYLNVTVNDIATKANVSIGTLYSYFIDKEDIFKEVISECEDMATELFKEKIKNINTETMERREIVSHVVYLLFDSLMVFGSLFNDFIEFVDSEHCKGDHCINSAINKDVMMYIGELIDEHHDVIKIKNKELAKNLVFNLGHATFHMAISYKDKQKASELFEEFIDMIHKYLFS